MAAGLLAGQGARVRLLERARFPRQHVGESLQPASFQLIETHLGLGRGAFAAEGFARKYGAVYVWGQTRAPWTVLFDARLDAALRAGTLTDPCAGDFEAAWQVDRARFDHILLGAAGAKGADVVEDCDVRAIQSDGDRIAALVMADGRTLDADLVIDCSGQGTVVGRHFALGQAAPDLQCTATWGYVDGGGGAEALGGHLAPLGRHVQLVVSLPQGWAWWIPISATRTSVGLVVRARRRLSDDELRAGIQAAGLPVGAGAWVGPTHHARDWSYTQRRLVGANWLLAGDAAGFVDPVLSGGVDFAVRGGANAALAALRHLSGTAATGAAALAAYEHRATEELSAYLDLARLWYSHNPSVEGLFWRAAQTVAGAGSAARAFVELTSGQHGARRHLHVFQRWQEAQMARALLPKKNAVPDRLPPEEDPP